MYSMYVCMNLYMYLHIRMYVCMYAHFSLDGFQPENHEWKRKGKRKRKNKEDKCDKINK